ncbi:MAG: carboxymuconolactone decarboxylase family protein [Planctomycetota bacterium]|nr:MAG: carboxymuconolactone decarboxylase family protein [Planctomycetota bacterium]
MTPRIEPVPKDAWTSEQQALLRPLEQRNQLFNIFTTLAHHPPLYRDWLTFARYILSRSTLPARDREIVILRIGWLCGAEYEWAQHVRIGREVGLDDADIGRVANGPGSEGLNAHERSLLQATDELHADARIADGTWNALAKTYSTQQLMDLVFTIGQYNLVSMALKTFGVELDEGLEGFARWKSAD